MKPAKTARHSRSFDYFLLIAALLLGVVGAWLLRQPEAAASSNLGLWAIFGAVCLLGGYALRRMDAWLPEASALPVLAPVGAAIWRKRGWLCLIAAGSLMTGVVSRLWPDYRQWQGTVLPWLISLGMVLLGSHLLGKPDGPQPNNRGVEAAGPKPDFPLPRWLEITGFLMIAALAVFLRVYRLDIFPPGIYVDETNGALDALQILEGNGASPFATGWYETPNGYIYYMAGMIRLFGANWYTLKAISILPAVLTVLAVFPLGRMMFGPLGGLAAMLFTAVSRWHLSMSRFGWNETAVPLFQILATYFLLRGLRERRFRDYATAGVISGLMMYTYLSSRLALATLGLFLIYWLLTDPDGVRTSLKRHLAGIILFGFAFMAAFAPLAVTYITNPFTFSNRVNEISVFGDIEREGSLRPLLLNVQDQLRFFHQVGDHQGKHNLPYEPETDPVTGTLFVIGLGYAAMRLRDRRRGLLWLWLLLGLAGGVFSSHSESPQSYRTLTALPAVTLLAGDVLSRVLRGSFRVLRGKPSQNGQRLSTVLRTAGTALFGICLIGAAAWESSVFIQRQMVSPQVKAWFNPVEYAVANEVVGALESGQTIYLTPDFYTFSPMRFLVYGSMKPKTGINTLDNPPYRLVRPVDTLPIAANGQDAVFLLEMAYQPVADYFLTFYPHASIETVQPAESEPLYLRVTVPRDDLAAIQGLEFTARLQTGEVVNGRTANLTLPAGFSSVESVEWRGSLRLESSGYYEFSATGGMSLVIDESESAGERFLCSGLHPVTVRWEAGPSSEPSRVMAKYEDFSTAEITTESWFTIDPPEKGLTGTYYRGTGWSGEPLCTRSTPFLLLAWPDEEPVAGAFSAKFSGKLRVSTAGKYRLIINADDGARITLDGEVIGVGLVPNQTNDIDVQVELAAGDHPIQVDYFQAGGGSALEFRWQPPGEQVSVVPMEALIP